MPQGTPGCPLAAAVAALNPDAVDREALRALVETMRTWDADQVAMYRETTAAAVLALGKRPLAGFLAAEVLALTGSWGDGAFGF